MAGAPPDDDALEAMLTAIATRRGVDLRDYRRETLLRLAEARAVAAGAGDLVRYAELIAHDPGETDALLAALLVPVTGFFRDPEVYAAIASHVLPDLLRRAPLVRAWAAAAATGEEGWSLAIQLADACERVPGAAFDLVVSDLDARSVETARRGCYPPAALADVPEAERARHFRVTDGRACVADARRAGVHFAQHDVLGPRLAPRAAVLAAFDLVLFRNALIYFDQRLQAKALQRLVGAMADGGALVLGQVEVPPAELSRALEPYPGVAPSLRIYRVRERRG